MGQHFQGAILKKNHQLANEPILFSVNPRQFRNFSKLMEHSYIGNKYVEAFMTMIADDTLEYLGYPVAWIGDYADAIYGKDYHQMAIKMNEDSFAKYKSIIKPKRKQRQYKYLVNLSKKQYVVLPPYNPSKLQIHPLPLLTAYGNGRGGGDYSGIGENLVGYWAFDRIIASNDSRYVFTMKELKVNF